MSGSGACVFAEFATLDMAATTLRNCPSDDAWLARAGLDHHPLRALAD
jgi:4-diphosphocytidyl-2C-methyl-D-erythritol kinase